MDKHFHLWQLARAGAGFGPEEEERLIALGRSVQLNRFDPALPAESAAVHSVLKQWARHNILAPRDVIYAQRLWLLGLAGLASGVSLDALAGAVHAAYAQLGGQSAASDRPDYPPTLKTAARADAIFLKYCYESLNQ